MEWSQTPTLQLQVRPENIVFIIIIDDENNLISIMIVITVFDNLLRLGKHFSKTIIFELDTNIIK